MGLHANAEVTLLGFFGRDDETMRVLVAVRNLGLPDCWVAAGFVRNAVWDRLHGREPIHRGDVDVIWYDASSTEAERDRLLEAALRTSMPGVDWSVKNQARMHRHNGHGPYASSSDAMAHWPETATAIGVRLAPDGSLDACAPLGFDDLFGLVVRPGPSYAARLPSFRRRVAEKGWLRTWPGLRVVETPG